MKKFDFPLQKVLEYKIHLQKQEQNVLSQLQYEYNQMLAQMNGLLQEFEKCKDDYLQQSTDGASAKSICLLGGYLRELQDRISELSKKLFEKAEQVERQRGKLLDVTKEKTSLEKLRDKSYQSYQFLARKEDERFIDEFVSSTAAG